MAGSLSNYSEVEQLKWVVGQDGAMGSSLTRYLGAATAIGTDGATPTEVANANGYARVNMNGKFGTAPTAGAPSTVSNDAEVAFPTATGSWGTVTHIVIYDSATYGAGNVIAWADITSAAITTNDILKFLTGEIDITSD